MSAGLEKHRRRSIRLKGYDYKQAGAYFVTIVTRERACLFGEIVDGETRLNDAGRVVQAVWDDLPNHYCAASLAAVTCWVKVPTMGDFPFAHLA